MTATGPVLRNTLAETLKAGKLALAMIVKQVASVDIAVAAKTCGYDAINVDLEHSVIPESAAAQICITALNIGITPIVPTPTVSPTRLWMRWSVFGPSTISPRPAGGRPSWIFG